VPGPAGAPLPRGMGRRHISRCNKATLSDVGVSGTSNVTRRRPFLARGAGGACDSSLSDFKRTCSM
jgi:hypothetical protein